MDQAREQLRQAMGELEAALMALDGTPSLRARESAERYLLAARAHVNGAAAAIHWAPVGERRKGVA